MGRGHNDIGCVTADWCTPAALQAGVGPTNASVKTVCDAAQAEAALSASSAPASRFDAGTLGGRAAGGMSMRFTWMGTL